MSDYERRTGEEYPEKRERPYHEGGEPPAGDAPATDPGADLEEDQQDEQDDD